MANTFTTIKRLAREALPLLSNNLVTPNLYYKDYSQEFQGKGDTIQVERPVVFVADEFGSSINLQEITEKTVFVKMDKIADVSFDVTQKDLALSIQDFNSKYLEAAALAIAEQINSNGLNLYKYVNSYGGTSGTTPDGLDDFADAEKRLNINKVPMSNRNAIWDPTAKSKFQILDSIVNAEKSGTTSALRDGSIGRISGMDNYMSQAVETHVAGDYTALTDVTAAADVSAANSKDTTGTNFEYTAVTLTSAAGTSTDKLLKGDLLSFADDEGNVHQVTVIEDTAEAASGVVTAKVFPAIEVDVTDTDVTFPDSTAGGHVANMAFHPKAFAFVTRPMAPLAGQVSYTTNYNGIAMRVTLGSDVSTKKTTMSVDCLYGFAPLYPQLATRILG